MQNPYKEIATVLEGRTARHINTSVSGIQCELGIITDTGLKLDGFKYEIQDYLVAEYLTMKEDFFTTTELNSGAHSQYTGDGKHDHKIITPDQLKPLKTGDRVLAVPVNGGKDFVVVGRVIPYA